MRITASSLLGVGLLLLGATAMTSWALALPWLVFAAAGAHMVFNTGLCFTLAGCALAAESFLSAAGAQRVRACLGALIALIAGLTLAEYLADLDLGIDLPGLHRWSRVDNPHPGRMSIPTALGFLLAGAVLVWMDRVRGVASGLAVQGLTGAVFLIGFVGFSGRAVNLPLMYPESAFASMAPQTALLLIAASTALWLAWRRADWYRARRLIGSEEQRISLAGAAVLSLIVCISVLSGFAIMARQLEAAARTGLLESLKSQIQIFRITIDSRLMRASVIASRPVIGERLARLNADGPQAALIEDLKAEAETARQLGFSAIAFYGLHGELRAAVGQPTERPALVMPIEGTHRSAILWDGGFVLYLRMTVEHAGRPAGVVVAEQQLAALTDALRAADDFAASAEIRVCKRVADDLECVRQAPPPEVFRIAYSRSLPIARAFEGTAAAIVGRDDRGHLVMAAVGPIGTTGLAMALKLDTAELYAPLRRQLYLAFLSMIAMIALGAWLLRQRVAPLVRQLEKSEERLALALEGSRFALWDLDARTGRVWLDSQWARMLGAGSAPIHTTSQELMRLVHPDDVAPLQQHLAGVLQGKVAHYDIEHRVKKPSGEWLWIQSRGKVVERDPGGRAVRLAGSNADIDLRKQLELRLAHQAGHDALTGLPNRNLFHDRMERAIGRSRRHRALMAVMYLDIDKFKVINDTWGHDVGDALIRGFAHRLVECIRNTDSAARLGGDEFAVILEELEDAEAGRRVAEKIVAAMREEFVLGERTLAVSTSVGISFYGGTGQIDADAIVKQADQALYEAKAAGRNTYRVSAEAAA